MTDLFRFPAAELAALAYHVVSVKLLATISDPFSAWEDIDRPITRREVRACMVKGLEELCETPLWSVRFGGPLPGYKLSKEEIRTRHIKKIAYFAKHQANTPIEIDVGVPSMRCHVERIVQDGNHRLAGAVVSRTLTIAARVGGSVARAEELGVWAPNEFELEIWRRFEQARQPSRRALRKP
jgi:hypothetical protein